MRSCVDAASADHVVNGLRLRVTTWGSRGDGLTGTPPVLLLHGFPTSSQLWRAVAPEMCKASDDDLFVIAPDLVQLGDSERTGRRIDLATQAHLISGLLAALDVSQVVVAGHGLGGAVAVHLAALSSERVAGLALLDAPLHADAWPVAGVLPMLVRLFWNQEGSWASRKRDTDDMCTGSRPGRRRRRRRRRPRPSSGNGCRRIAGTVVAECGRLHPKF